MGKLPVRKLIVVASMLALCGPVWGDIWQIPLIEQPADIDHIQIQVYHHTFHDQVFFNFFAVDENGVFDFNGLLWSQIFINDIGTFAAASGPSIGNGTLAFTLQIEGDKAVDRPAFHYQTYLGETLVTNLDIACVGPNDADWVITAGTWVLDVPAPPFVPGDANRDAKVTLGDLQILGDNWYATNATWGQADFNGDGTVNLSDLQIMGDNWHYGYAPYHSPDSALAPTGMIIPEPSIAGLFILGLASPFLLRKRFLG